MQLIRMHPQQLSLLSSKLIKQMPPYPTFYKEQHVIDSSLARKRLYFNFDWFGPPPKFSPFSPKKEVGRGDLTQVNNLLQKFFDIIIILYTRPKTDLAFFFFFQQD